MRAGLAATVVAAVLLLGCGGAAGQPASSSGADRVGGDLTVFAAASLTDAFDRIGQDFSRGHPGVRVTFDYGGSSSLVTQILQGAPADVFASADQPNMQKLVDGGLAQGAAAVFAGNSLQIVVQAGNPKRITSLADLASRANVVVLCAPAVPCGTYAGQALKQAGLTVTPRSQEQDVKQVVSKVALGEADAGIVYRTDVRAGGARVEGVEIPSDQNVPARYPIVEVRGSRNPAAARAFIAWVLGSQGQAVLAGLGFTGP